MGKFLTASAAALALAGTTLGAVAPAEARGFHGGGGYHGGGFRGGGYGGYRGGYGGHYYRGGGAGWAVGAGILGLAAGAAIASRPYYGGYYGYAGPAYYAPPPGYYDGYAGYCRSDWRWDGWARRYVRVRYCD